MLHRRSGQSIIEILIAVAIGAVFMIGAAALIAPALKSSTQAQKVQIGAALGDELVNNVRVWSEDDWHNVLNLATSSAYHYYLNTSISPFAAVAGDETVAEGSSVFLRYFYVDDVYRDSSGNITASGGTYDPSTKKITVQYGLLNYSGSVLSPWGVSPPSSSTTGYSPAVIFGNTLYVLSLPQQSLYYTAINTTGSIGPLWNTTTTPYYALGDATQYSGYIYAGGLGSSGSPTSTIFYGKLNSTNGVGSWINGTPLPSALQGSAVVAYGGNLYVIGGGTTTVFFAPINTDGSVGSWTSTTPTPSLSPANIAGSAVAYNNYLYLIAAPDSGGNATKTVFYAPINASGSVGAWATTTPLPSPLEHAGSAVFGGRVYVLGGAQSAITVTSTVLWAPISTSGTLGSWSQTANLPTPIWQSHSAVKNPYIYNIGGYLTAASSSVTSTVTFTNFTGNGATAVVSNTISMYVSRNRTAAYNQTDWSGGPGQSGPATTTNNKFSSSQGITYTTPGTISLAFNNGYASSSFVQATSSLVIASATSTSLAFPSGNAATDTLVVAATWSTNSSVTSTLSDTKNNSYSIAVGPEVAADGKTTAEIWYATNIAAGANTVTLALGATVQNITLHILEYGNLSSSPLDTNVWNTSSSGTALDSGYASTSASNELIFGFGVTPGAATSSDSAGNGFAARTNVSSSMSEDEVVYAAGSYDATMNQANSGNWLMLMAAFKLAGTGSIANTPNISSGTTQHWAWNDNVGWINFYGTNTVVVSSTAMGGYASSTAGDISLDCNTTRIGSLCASSNYQVTNDGAGDLSGWAWNDEYGWIALFWGNPTSNSSSTGTYSSTCNSYGSYCGVYIDSNGNFQGYAWNDAIGWISFNCDNTGGPGCGSSSYKVQTSWRVGGSTGSLDSTTYDTGVASGAQFNSVLWQGTLPTAAVAEFQLAVSNVSSGPWAFEGPSGDGTTWYNPGGAGTAAALTYNLFNNYRYFRYRINLIQGDGAGASSTPNVNDVIVNWSP